jgi:hypothetical protein
MSYSSVFAPVAPTFQLRGDVGLSALAFGFFSGLTVCDAPAMTAGDVRVYLVVVDVRIETAICIWGCLAFQALYSNIYRPRPQCNTSIKLHQILPSTVRCGGGGGGWVVGGVIYGARGPYKLAYRDWTILATYNTTVDCVETFIRSSKVTICHMCSFNPYVCS